MTNPMSSPVEVIARALAHAADDGAFDHEDDPERWDADEEDRSYWTRLAQAGYDALRQAEDR